MHLIWHSRRGRRRNYLWQIFWWSVEGCWFCGGSKIALSHWQSQWPLTQGWRYRAACDCCICYDISTWWCRGEHYIFRLSVRRVCMFVCSFVQTDLVTTISHEWPQWQTDRWTGRQTDTTTCTSPQHLCNFWLHDTLQLLLLGFMHVLNASDAAYCYKYYM